MFKEYKSKQIIRLAHKVVKGDIINSVADMEATYQLYMHDTGETAFFNAYEEVKVGDYVVRLTIEDTYHCSAAVFAERNIIEEE